MRRLRARSKYRHFDGDLREELEVHRAAGLLWSVAAGFGLRSYLFGLSPLDPLAYLAVTALMGGAAIVATAVPARRALRVDPAGTLKSE